jgi:hypothetical protein
MKLLHILPLLLATFIIGCGQNIGPTENTAFDKDDAEVNGDPEAKEDPAEESEEE